MKSKEHQPCLKEKLGSCMGCNVMAIAILGMRWRALTLDEATREIHQEYCPVTPDDARKYINRDAGIGFSQRRHENVEFTTDRKPLRQRPSKGLPNTKMSKKVTGTFFRKPALSYLQTR